MNTMIFEEDEMLQNYVISKFQNSNSGFPSSNVQIEFIHC